MRNMKRLLAFMLVGCLIFTNSFAVNAEESSGDATTTVSYNAEEYSTALENIIQNNTVEESGDFATKRLIIKGNYEGETYGAIEVVHKEDYLTILQYETSTDAESAYNSLTGSGNDVSIDSTVILSNYLYPESYDFIDEDAVTLIGMNIAQFNGSGIYDTDVKVAIIDTGIDSTSKLFQSNCPGDEDVDGGRVLSEYNCVAGEDENTEYEVTNIHGEYVAGVLSDASGSHVFMDSYRVTDSEGYTTLLSVELALNKAIANNCDVINMSLGVNEDEYGKQSLLDETIELAISKGIPVIVAAGNSNNGGQSTENIYPARLSYCWTIGAIEKDKSRASFSNYNGLDFVAPGSSIVMADDTTNSGTSFSTPYISAMIGTVLSCSEYSNYSVEQLHKVLSDNCEDLGEEGYDDYYGNGLPNLSKFIEYYEGEVNCPHTKIVINEETGEEEEKSTLVLSETVEPTCTELGKYIYTCDSCQSKVEEEFGELAEHDYVVESSSCKDNTITYKCSVCEEVKTEDSETQIKHTWEILEDRHVEPTCLENGSDTKKCSVCELEEIVTIETSGHSWDEGEVISPTCTEDGYTLYTCTVCEETKQEDIVETSGHSFKQGSGTPGTCKNEGHVRDICTVCLELVDTKLPKDENNHAGTKTTKRTEAKCGVEGKIETICDDCGKVISTTKIPKLEHKLTTKRTEPTCTSEGSIVTTCTVCNKTLNTVTLPKVAHTFKEERTEPTKIKDGKVVRTCTVCKHTETEVLPKKGFVVGDTFTKGNYKLKVTKAGEVSVIGSTVKKTNKRFKSVNIGKSISYGGFTFKVTSVGARAFKGYKYITQVTIGENVRSIGKEAFYGCNVKIIKIQGTKLKSIGKDAFKNIKSNATFKVPKSKVKYYKKLLKKKTGYKSTMKVKKK